MRIITELKKVENLSRKWVDLMNRRRRTGYVKGSSVDFKKEDKEEVFFFVKENGKKFRIYEKIYERIK